VKFVFIDESGDEGLNVTLPGISSFYVLCGLVVDGDKLKQAIAVFDETRKKFFPNGEMKSSAVKDQHRRLLILRELIKADFSLHVLVGNKSLIKTPGLRYPKSFIKHLHGRLYGEMVKDCPKACFRSDEIKNPSFVKELRAYLEKHYLFAGLFEYRSFEFVKSSSDVCIQAADFIGGSIRLCFENDPLAAMCNPAMETLRSRLTYLMPYPEQYCRYIAKIPESTEHDQAIESRAVLDAEEFLRKHDDEEDPAVQMLVRIVRRLLQALATGDHDGWVSTEVLMGVIESLSKEPLTEHMFRGLIAKLRDAGLLVCSRPSWGYKIAISTADVRQFLNRQNSQIAPMLARVRTARTTVSRATNNAVDILGYAEFSSLKAAVDATPHWSVPVTNPDTT
jgi:hypothetical protein